MKKIFFLLLASIVFVSSCKKKENDVSIEVTVSYPVITFNNGMYYSINVGGALPSAAVVASAYDTFYKQSCPVVLNFNAYQNLQTGFSTTGVNNLQPGLYTAVATAKNQFGYVSYALFYVGVTNISDSLNLTGNWINNGIGVDYARVNKVATGMFTTSNILGVDSITDAGDYSSGLFLVTSPTTIVFAPNTTASITGDAATLTLGGLDDTTMVYTGTLISGTAVNINYLKQ